MYTPARSNTNNLQISAQNVARKLGLSTSKTWNKVTGYPNNGYSHLTAKKTDYHWGSTTSSSSPFSITKLVAGFFCFLGLLLVLNFVFAQNLKSETAANGLESIPSVLGEVEREEDRIPLNRDEGFPALMDNADGHPSPSEPHHSGKVLETGGTKQGAEEGAHSKPDVDHSEELNELFERIKTDSDDSEIARSRHSVEEDPNLEEESMKSLRSDKDKMESLRQSERAHSNGHSNGHWNGMEHIQSDPVHHFYSPYPLGLSDPDRGLYFLVMVADNDRSSKVGTLYQWRSYLQHAKLEVHRLSGGHSVGYEVDLQWIAPPFHGGDVIDSVHSAVAIDGTFSEKGRGMELSELVVFNDQLLAFDDRTGIVYEVTEHFEAIPRHIVMEGDGNVAKGMKVEWATYKEDEELLYIGSIGREYTDRSGVHIAKTALLWIATLDRRGVLRRQDWTSRYMAMREATGTLFPGYLWIEAVEWSAVHRKWFVAPRFLSFEAYDSTETGRRGANLLIVASEDFGEIEMVWIRFEGRTAEGRRLEDVVDDGEGGRSRWKRYEEATVRVEEGGGRKQHGIRTVGDLNTAQLRAMSVKQENMKQSLKHSELGFSTMKFLEGTGDTLLVAVRTHETEHDLLESVLSVFDIDGNVFLNQYIDGNNKYEGIAVL